MSAAEGEVDHLQWSPDGQRLVFTRGAEGLVHTPASGAVDPLVKGTRPRWISPNTIIYESGADPTDEEVGVLRTSLGGTQSQMLLPWAFHATTSGDGMVLAYAYPREDDDPHLYVKYGRRETRVAGSTRFDRDPALSPDGRYLAFVRCDTSTAEGTYSVRLLDRTTGIESELAGGLKSWPRVEFGADGSLVCAAIPAEGATTCFRVRPPAGENPTEALAFGDMRPTIVVPFGAPARRP